MCLVLKSRTLTATFYRKKILAKKSTNDFTFIKSDDAPIPLSVSSDNTNF